MIKRRLLPILLISVSLVITACATKSETPATEPVQTEKEAPVVEEKKPEKKVEEKKPEDPPNVKFAKKLQELLEKGDTEGAIALFQDMPSELKDDVELKLLLGALYYSTNSYDDAIKVANEVLETEPSNLDALELISLCNRAKGDKTAYKATAEKILATDPYNTSVNIQKAEDYALNKKYKLARDSYKKALQGDSENEDAMFGYAQMSFYIDDVKTAKEVFQQMLDKDPANPAALAYMGKIAYDDENYLRASKFVSEAIKYDPNNYDYWMDYGKYLRYQGKFEEAAKAWTHATELDPSYFLAYAYLAGHYDELGNWDAALANYHKVIETNPKYYYAYESTAILEYHAKNYKEAIKYFSKAYEFSDNWSYSMMIALCYFKLNDSFNAKKILQAQLKKLNRDSTEYNLVRFYAESYNKNAESNLKQRIEKETNSNNRGKMLFYMGAYCELNKAADAGKEYYGRVTNMQAPMFFEYRLAEWGLKE